MYSLYSVLAVAFCALVSPWFLYQAIRHRKYLGSLSQRMGYLPVSFNVDGEPSIWIHAVSVGEVLTARPLARDLKARYPRLRLFLSTTTLSGQGIARRSVPEADEVFYFPFDLGIFVRRTLALVRPRLFIMMETEIWPNLLRECRRRGVKTAIVNGRLSERSYPRYRLVRGFMKTVLDDVDAFCVQSEEAARRFIELGANPGRVSVTGSLKFDSLELAPSIQSRGRERVLRYFRISGGAPRHRRGKHDEGRGAAGALGLPARAFDAAQHAADSRAAPSRAGGGRRAAVPQRGIQDGAPIGAGHRRRAARRCRHPRHHRRARHDLSVATVAFVGGSLVDTGGHNILEPAVFGKPIVFGPHMSNFAEIAAAFVANVAAVQVKGERELADVMIALMTDPVRRARLGAAARALVEANRGAKDKSLAVLSSLLPQDPTIAFPANVRPFRPIA